MIVNTILAGCSYSVPWVKALFHCVCQFYCSKNVKPPVPHACNTYVDDVVSISAALVPDIHMNVRFAVAFQIHLSAKHMFVVSPKNFGASSHVKLAQCVADELADYGQPVWLRHLVCQELPL